MRGQIENGTLEKVDYVALRRGKERGFALARSWLQLEAGEEVLWGEVRLRKQEVKIGGNHGATLMI
jgi:hypothetical protein